MRRLVALSLLSLLAVVAVPAQARAFGQVVVQASHSGSVSWSLTKPTQIKGVSAIKLTRGTYAGYTLRDSFGSTRLSAFLTPGADGDVPAHGNGDWDLAPGRYTFTLVTDGQATVTLGLSGSKSYALVASKPTGATGWVSTIPPTIAGVPYYFSRNRSITNGAGYLLAHVVITHGLQVAATVDRGTICLTDPGSNCSTKDYAGVDFGEDSEGLFGTPGGGFNIFFEIPDRSVAAGHYDLSVQFLSFDSPTKTVVAGMYVPR